MALDALSQTYEHVVIDAGMIRDIPLDLLPRLTSRAVLAVSRSVDASVLSGALDDLQAAGLAAPIVLVAGPARGVEAVAA
jgi:hypothetical protein